MRYGNYTSKDYSHVPATILQAIGIQQRGKIADRQQDIAERGLDLDERQVKLAETKQQAEIPVAETQFSAGEISGLKAADGAFGKKMGFRLNTFTPVANAIQDYTAQGYKKIDVYRAIKGDWNNLVKPARTNIQKAMEKAIESGDQQTLADLTELDTAMADKTFIDKFMPASAKYERDSLKTKDTPKSFEEALVNKIYEDGKVSLEEVRKLETYMEGSDKPAKAYDKPYIGPLGNLLQKEKDSEKVTRISGKGGSGQAPKAKKLKTIRDNYYKQITQARSAAKNIDFTNVAMGSLVKNVRKDAREKADILAKEYVEAGGKLEDLGLKEPEKETIKKYKSADAVKAAFKKGTLTEKEATKILMEKF